MKSWYVLSLSRSSQAVVAATLLPATAGAQQKVLKFIPQADLRILDPIATTAYITRNHGYMVYDTLFAHGRQVPGPAADGGQVGGGAGRA